MPRPIGEPQNDAIDRLLNESQQIIDDIASLQTESPDQSGPLDERLRREAQRRFSEIRRHDEQVPSNGFAEVSVADDEMTAYADFFPPTEGMRPIQPEDVEEELSARGVVFGVDWERITQTLQDCNIDRRETRNVPIAVGCQPRHEVPEHIVPSPVLARERGTAGQGEEMRIDYKLRSPFVLVSEGEELARVEPLSLGQVGRTVRDRELPFDIEQHASIQPGANTVLEGGRLLATCDGTVELKNGTIQVSEVLQIDSDVDYHTGHVDFPGDVIIKGQIKDGFRVASGASIFCEETMDASEITAEKDLTVRCGLIGRKMGSVKVGGTVRVKFIENCYVEAGEGVYSDGGVLNSEIYTLGAVELGKRGVIVGGQVRAQSGVVAAQIGTKTGPKTEIYCGMDYAVEKRLDWIREQCMLVAAKLKQTRDAKKAHPSPQLDDLEQRLQQALARMNDAAEALLYRLHTREDATITVRGTVHPGTYIEICNVSHTVHEPCRGVVFRLLKTEGKVVAEKLQSSR